MENSGSEKDKIQQQPEIIYSRRCGEHTVNLVAPRGLCGSSLHVRGTQRDRPELKRIVPFIPTRAGNTGQLVCRLAQSTVHPHTCGEHSKQQFARQGTGRSSPHVRGTRRQVPVSSVIVSFIPTRAGNTRLYALHQSEPFWKFTDERFGVA